MKNTKLTLFSATCTNWAVNLAISTTFLTLIEALTASGAFWLYCGLSAVGVVFLFFTLPETKKKSLEEIADLFAKAESPAGCF